MDEKEKEKDIRLFFDKKQAEYQTNKENIIGTIVATLSQTLYISRQSAEMLLDDFISNELVPHFLVFGNWELSDDTQRCRWIASLMEGRLHGKMCGDTIRRYRTRQGDPLASASASERAQAVLQWQRAHGVAVERPRPKKPTTKATTAAAAGAGDTAAATPAAAHAPSNGTAAANGTPAATGSLAAATNATAPTPPHPCAAVHGCASSSPTPAPGRPLADITHPHGPYEWAQYGHRYYPSRDGQPLQLPDSAPDRPSPTARWNPLKCKWID